MRVRFLFYSIERAKRINRRFLWIGERLGKIFFTVKYDLARAGLDIEDSLYLTPSFFSALIYFLIAFFFLFALLYLRDPVISQEHFIFPAFAGSSFFVLFFFIHLIYPGLIAKRYTAGIDRSLMFALKSMLIQVSSGVSLYNSMVNVSKSNYGVVSKEFREVVQDISAGESESAALEELALKTKSEYLKRTIWQLTTSLRSGASLSGALQSVVETLTNYQARAIKNYAAELNLWILIYLLFAAAIPTLGITFLVVLSALGGTSIGPSHIALIVAAAFIIQVGLISFVKTRIPKVYL